MKLRSFFILFFVFISQFIPIYSAQTYLSSGDVKGMMNQLFDYHVDQKEMTTTILERSLKIYLNQFDSGHSYLQQDEVVPYIQPSEYALRKMLHEFHKDRYTTYFVLNQKIQDGIIRAREWRRQWEKFPHQLIQDAKAIKIEKEKKLTYARNLEELKQRHYHWFLQFVAFQMKELGIESIEGNGAKLIALCEKQIAHVENDYLGVDDQNRSINPAAQEHHVILHTLKALAHSLDAHTAYYSPDEAYAIKVQLEKGMCGIGVVLREGIDGITIQDLIAGGPAAKSGEIQKGDTIIEVDGEVIDGYSFHKVLERMKGKEGSKTVLGILRHKAKENPEFFRVELTRSNIVLADKRVDVEGEPYGDGVIGKITLYSFYEGDEGLSSEKDLKNAIDELRNQGPIYGLILDMRENTGGFLSQAVRVSSLFISSGVVVISKYSDGSMKYYRAIDGTRYFEGPLVVLISRGSASAAEIVAQTLKDYGVGIIVGDEQSYGKGTIQHQTLTSGRNRSLFKVTIGKYYTVSGKSTQIGGVKSDIVVPTEYNFDELGEAFLDYPLPADQVASAYHDQLPDIDPFAKKWFQKYYIPSLQQKEVKWEGMIPILRNNSLKRVAQNRNYQLFLKEIQAKIEPKEAGSFGVNDLQKEEAVNIIKDMIFFENYSEI